MNRYRWVSIDVRGRTIDEVYHALHLRRYTEDSGVGFLLDERRTDVLVGRYVEKRVYDEDYETPFGDKWNEQRVEYDVVRFRLNAFWPGILLENPPRSVSRFYTYFSQSLSFDVAFDPLDVDLESWVKELELCLGEVQVVRARLSKLSLQRGVEASVVIGGSGDIRKTLEEFIGDKFALMDRVSLLLPSHASRRVELTRYAGVSLPNSMGDVLDHVQSALLSAVKR